MKHFLDKKNNDQTYLSATVLKNTIQNKAVELQDNRPAFALQRKKNNTGLPNSLKSGIEDLSGHSLDDVKVHYNSSKPAQLNAHAYAQGTNIHVASGQEKHLPHEAWHVVQQKQGRVKPTTQMKGKVNINDDRGLEDEADVMGAKALQRYKKPTAENLKIKKINSIVPVQLMRNNLSISSPTPNTNVIQLAKFTPEQRRKLLAANKRRNGGFHTCTHCGFQHSKKRYATLKGRRIGDANFQIDHIIHLSRGGRNLLRNGRVLCGTCNASRGNRALVGRTGISKYRALHQKTFRKNYLRKPSQNY